MTNKCFPTRLLAWLFVALFLVSVTWDWYLFRLPSHINLTNYLFNIAYATIPAITGYLLLAYVFSRRLGGEIASSLAYLGLAAAAFALGLYFWSYYNIIAHVAIPHPSVGDAFFLVYPWLLVVGTLRLLRFYTPLLSWPVLLEALGVFFVAAVPIYRYFIVPSLSLDPSFLDSFIVFDTLIANAALLGVAYLLWRIGGGRLRFVLSLYSLSYLALSAGDFLFQYRNDNGLYWNGDLTDTLLIIHLSLFALASVYLLDSVVNPAISQARPPASAASGPQSVQEDGN